MTDQPNALLDARFTIEDDVFVDVRGLVGSHIYLWQTAPDSGDESQINLSPSGALALAEALSSRLSCPTQPSGEVMLPQYGASLSHGFSRSHGADDNVYGQAQFSPSEMFPTLAEDGKMIRTGFVEEPTTPAREAIEAAAKVNSDLRAMFIEGVTWAIAGKPGRFKDAVNSAIENQCLKFALPSNPGEPDAPLDMVLYCPKCGFQHIDEPSEGWDNPPHRSHLCHGCGCIWRPADVATNGVAAIKTCGEADSWGWDGSSLNGAAPAASGGEVFGSPANDDLARLIETRLLGVDPDSQDLQLEDHDWKRIIAAISTHAGNGGQSDGGEA